MQKIIIYGNGRIARVVYQFIKKQYEVCAFTVDSDFIKTDQIEGLPLIGFENVSNTYPASQYKMIVAVGYIDMNAIRYLSQSTPVIVAQRKLLEVILCIVNDVDVDVCNIDVFPPAAVTSRHAVSRQEITMATQWTGAV